jgi:hypothetical protein
MGGTYGQTNAGFNMSLSADVRGLRDFDNFKINIVARMCAVSFSIVFYVEIKYCSLAIYIRIAKFNHNVMIVSLLSRD